jgi:hypothetical protein
MVHQLKCWPEYFLDLHKGLKTFEVRRGVDREYHVGDVLRLQEWNPQTRDYTGFEIQRVVRYVMHGDPFLPEDMWILGLVEVA